MGDFIFQEEQDIKALQAKNRKLGEALDQRQVGFIFNNKKKSMPLACSTGNNMFHNYFFFLAGYRRWITRASWKAGDTPGHRWCQSADT